MKKSSSQKSVSEKSSVLTKTDLNTQTNQQNWQIEIDRAHFRGLPLDRLKNNSSQGQIYDF